MWKQNKSLKKMYALLVTVLDKYSVSSVTLGGVI